MINIILIIVIDMYMHRAVRLSMNIFFMTVSLLLLSIIISIKIQAATKYVDGTLAQNCTGNYSIDERKCTGGDGDAYSTLSTGISGIVSGDTLNIRSGTYTVSSTISLSSFNSATLTTTIQAYNNEVVEINKTTISGQIFSLGNNSRNILFQNIKFSSQQYAVITGTWTNISGNVWSIPLATNPNQLRFNTTNGNVQASQAAIDSANEYYWASNILYIYSTSDPSTIYTTPGINVVDNFNAMAIGGTSGGNGNLITINNCEFTKFAHAGIKGGQRFVIRNSRFSNIGTDGNDHNLYLFGVQTAGSEALIEYNYFEYTPGASFHFYGTPSYIISRYNIINGLSGSNRSQWGALLSGDHLSLYNNTFYGNQIGVAFYSSASHHNNISNNIFYNNSGRDIDIDSQGGASKPINNVSTNNYFGSTSKCGGCSNQSGNGGDNYTLYVAQPPNIQGTTNPFSSGSPTNFNHFALGDSSIAINAGNDLGESSQLGLDPRDSNWPLPTLNQSLYGSWDIGAFVYYTDITPPSISINPTTIITNNNTPTITGEVIDTEGTISNVEYQIDEESWESCTSSDGNFDEAQEEFECSIPEQLDGNHKIYFRAIDNNTNTTNSEDYESIQFAIDTTSPVVTIAPLTNNISNSSNINFGGTSTDEYSAIAGIEYQLDTYLNTWSACDASDNNFDSLIESYSCNISNISQGNHIIYIKSFDNLSNSPQDYSGSYSFTVDSIGPEITNVMVNSNSNSLTINWVSNDSGTSRILYGKTNSLGSESNWINTNAGQNSYILNGLSKCTNYYFKILSKDSLDNEILSTISNKSTLGCVTQATNNNDILTISDSGDDESIEAEKKYTLTLTVKNSEGNIISNATITIIGANNYSGKTDKNGQIQLKDVEKGNYQISITLPNGSQQNFTYRVEGISDEITKEFVIVNNDLEVESSPLPVSTTDNPWHPIITFGVVIILGGTGFVIWKKRSDK